MAAGSARVEWPRSVSVSLGAVLALVGGYLDAYTFVSRNGVFANSQTGNLVLFGVELMHGEWHRSARLVPPILAFIVGVLAAETLKRPAVAKRIRWPARAALVLELAVLIAVGFIPQNAPDSLVTVAIAFVASVQVSSFRTLIKWQYNTTMATGNLRSAVQAVYQALIDHDADAAWRARAFGAVMVAFIAGAMAGAQLTQTFGVRAVWVAAGLIALALWMFIRDHLHAASR